LLRKINKSPHPCPLPKGEGIKIEVLVDWNDNYEFEELDKKPTFIIWGDSKIIEIWAASIIAKVFRDKLIKTYSELYPDFSLEKHKWYWTKIHSDYLTGKNKITWIHRVSYKPVKKILEQKPKLLLHICCWPDATIPIIDLKKKYDITCFWYDPNIQPKSEYNKRLKHFKKVCKIEKIDFIEWEYDTDIFLKKVKWLENEPEKWKRCTKCYDLRLTKTIKLAKELWIDYWTSSLSISPHKDLNKLFKIWAKLDKKHWIKFLDIDFKKNAWFERSLDYCMKYKIYRQNYCGCIFSKNNK
jgi:ribonuclease HII